MQQIGQPMFSLPSYVIGVVTTFVVVVAGGILRDWYRRWREERDRKNLTAVKEGLSVTLQDGQVVVHVTLFNSRSNPVIINRVRLTTRNAEGTKSTAADSGDVQLWEGEKHTFDVVWWAPIPSDKLDALEIVHSEDIVVRREVPSDIRNNLDKKRAELLQMPS